MKQVIRRHRGPLLLLTLTFGVYFVYIFSQMLGYRANGLWAGHVHVWGDWSLHIAMVNIFAFKDPGDWFAYHPYYAGGKLTYGFLTNLVSGLLLRSGLSLTVSMLVPSMLYGIALTYGLYVLFYQLLRTQKAAVTSVIVFFCSSGLGFLRFLADWLNKPTLESLLYPTKDYTRLEKQYQWLAGNWFNGMLIPQRAFLLGMCITVWVMAGVLWVFLRVAKKPKEHLTKYQKYVLVACGLGAGLLPITHMHSFIVLVIGSGLLGLLTIKQWRKWLWYVIPAGILSSVLYVTFVKGGIENPQFMRILIGWTAPVGNGLLERIFNWLKMWWEIWGVMVPMALIGFSIARKKLDTFRLAFLGTGWVVFALANVILFQPIHWDNSKLFMWAYLFFSPMAVLVLQQLWREKSQLPKVVAMLLAVLLIGSGIMEMWRLARFDKNSLQMASYEDIELGEEIQQKTHPRAVFLTATSHNHPVMEWGARSILLGYPGWAFNFGFLYQQRERDIGTMFQGGPAAEELMKKYNVSYVAIGPEERQFMRANEAYFSNKYPIAVSSRNYRIYDVRSLTGGL
ncbi:hypothetical protein H3C70_02625 [Patescibacteria group bacterium]|nr:hypothetical protein [Patescibacteria group bacterium]